MENLLYILYFLPTIVCLLWAVAYVLVKKTARQNILLATIIIGSFYFSTYAIYSVPDVSYTLVAALESFSLPLGLITMGMLSIYVTLHITRDNMRIYYTLWLVPGLLYASSLTTLYSIIGYDGAGHFFASYAKQHIFEAPYDTDLYRVFHFVDYNISASLGMISCVVNIAMSIYLLYKEGYRPGGILSFLLQKKRATPSRVVAFAIIILCILLTFFGINFYYVISNPLLHSVLSITIALVIHLLCFAEYHSNLSVFSYNNLRKVHLYDNIVKQKEREEQEKEDAEKSRVAAVMQRDGNRSNLVENRRKQLSARFHKLMEEDQVFLRDDINVEDVTRELGVGRTVLSSFISYEYNTNFRGVINDYRIRYAKEYMLQHPTATQEAVALASGFKDAVTYTHKFKSVTGLSPVAWLNSQE